VSDGKFRIEFERHALRDLESVDKTSRLQILAEIQKYLSSTPYQAIKTRIKKMTGFSPNLYRLRVGDYRIYYRIHQQCVVILTILDKKDTQKWLNSQ